MLHTLQTIHLSSLLLEHLKKKETTKDKSQKSFPNENKRM